MHARNDSRGRAWRRIAVAALVACATVLIVENTILLALVALSKPWALFTLASALLRVALTLTVPATLLVLIGLLGWWLPMRNAGGTTRHAGASIGEGHHD